MSNYQIHLVFFFKKLGWISLGTFGVDLHLKSLFVAIINFEKIHEFEESMSSYEHFKRRIASKAPKQKHVVLSFGWALPLISNIKKRLFFKFFE